MTIADPATIDLERGWALLLAIRRQARLLPALAAPLALDWDEESCVVQPPGRTARLTVASDGSWTAQVPITEAGAQLLDLYLPLALASRNQPLTVAHLGQSLDGRIATANGASHYVTGPENLTHLHRMRALCDAIVVGASTVECDDPQLTTRRVSGPSPVRVILDPRRRLAATHGVFHDRAARTLLVCAEERADAPGPGQAERLGVPTQGPGLDLRELVRQLRERGLFALFIEGGGLTVSTFLEQGLLDRLQITIAPLIIGSGRPGLTLPPIPNLSHGLRPPHRRYVLGEDVLFDCRLRD